MSKLETPLVMIPGWFLILVGSKNDRELIRLQIFTTFRQTIFDRQKSSSRQIPDRNISSFKKKLSGPKKELASSSLNLDR